MACQVLVSQKGPLPIKVNFNSPGDLMVCLQMDGSVWSTSGNQMLGIQIAVDGQNVGTAQIFSNGASTHRAVVSSFVPLKLTYGPHSIALTAMANTTSDLNDLFTAVIHY